MPRPSTPELRALWASRQWYEASLYTIAGGNLGTNVLRYSSGDTDIIGADGNLYSCGGISGPYFDRKDNKAKMHQALGVQVDTLSLDILPGESTLFGVPFSAAVQAQIFDGATIIIDTAYMGVWGDTSVGTLRKFVGRIADVDAGDSLVTMTINSHLELLNSYFPNNVFSAGCDLSLGDAGCGVDLDAVGTTVHGTSSTTSPVLSNPDVTAGVVEGSNVVSGPYPGGTQVSHVSAFGITLTNNATASGAATVTFSNPVPFKTTGTVVTATQSHFTANLAGGPWTPTGCFNLGKLIMTSGSQSGLRSTVKLCTVGSPTVIDLMGYLPAAPVPGDTFTIYFGCDKSPHLPVTTVASATNGSPTLTNVANTQGILPLMLAYGPGLPTNPVPSVLSAAGNTVLLSAPVTANEVAQVYNFFSPNGCAKFGRPGLKGNGARFRGEPLTPQPALAV